jgi:hypothetical protein
METNTDTAITASQTSASFAKVVAIDTKLSRGEALDLLMEDLQKEMQAAHAAACAEVDASCKALEASLMVHARQQFQQQFQQHADIKVVTDEWNYHKQNYRPHVTITLAFPRDNAEATALFNAHKAAMAKRRAISDRIREMESSKTVFKNQVLRSILAGTPEGQAMLDALNNTKLAIKAKLLGDRVPADE